MSRVESLDGIARHAIHARVCECCRKLLCECDEHIDASIEQQSVDHCVWIATVDRSDRCADGFSKRVVDDRRDVAPPPEPSVRQQ